ncbi:MAG: FAD-dependent oxidoreductase [Actinomycetales bacterium]
MSTDNPSGQVAPTPVHGPPRRVTPALVIVASPDVIAEYQREIGSRYSIDYDLVCTTSGQEAEERTRELVAADIPIAMFITDIDLPDCSYDDLLRDLQPLCPTARRLLIVDMSRWKRLPVQEIRDSVSDGMIDAYLGLPRGPRDEEFHTAMAEMLSEWGWTANGPEVDSVQIVVSESSAGLAQIKDLFQRMGIPYRKYPVDSDVGRQVLTEAGPDAALPLVRSTDGRILSNPTVADLGAALYGSTDDLPTGYVADLAVIGAGPAGLASAVYGASEGLETIVIESEAVGGQAGTSSMIRNYLGFPRGISGMRLSQRARFQATRFGARFLIGRPVESMTLAAGSDPHEIFLAGGASVQARAVVVATGAQYRKLGVESVENLVGHGVHYGAAMSIAQGLRNAKVYVVGGGNSAGQAAVHLARFTPTVTMLVRRPGLEETMSEYLVREVHANPRITVRGCTEVVDGGGEGRLSWLQLKDTRTGREQRVRANALLLLLGADPCTDWLPDGVAVDPKGFILTGRDVPKPLWEHEIPPEPNATSLDGVFAVGDVRAGSMKRVASAAGEGASVVPLVHRHLSEIPADHG